jgi:drug/metabolite transporter (DMT)-like permease
MVIACVRSFFGAMTLLVIGRVLKAAAVVGDRRTFTVLAASGAVLALHWFTFFQAVWVSTVAIGVLGFGSMTLFSTFLEPIVCRERLRGRDVLAGVLVVGGLMLITPEFRLGNTHTQGLLWGIASGFLYAVFFLITRSSVRTLPAVTVAMYQQTFSGLVLLPFVWRSVGATPARDWATLLLLGVLFTGVLQWLTASSLRHLSVQTNSVLLGLEPVYSVLLAWALLHERPDLRTVLGGAVLIGTVLWTSLRGRHSA